MAVNSFLNTFRSGLKEIQSRQLLTLLTREKVQGNITTLDEFKTRLRELTAKLTATTIQPTLNLFLAEVGDLIDSDSYNFMLERIQDDLQSAFDEANTIDEVINAHETIINDVVLKNLELAVNDLESKIESLEFINGTTSGFDNAIFNTFRVTQNARSSLDEGVVFTDPKTSIPLDATNAATIDFIGEKLILGTNINEIVQIKSIRQIFDVESRASEIPVNTPNSNINNIIDNTIGTFWSQSVLLSKPVNPFGIITKLELDLGAIRSINSVQIEPIFLAPVYLSKISYLDGNNQYQDILTNPILVNSTNKLFFNSISTSKLLLTFNNTNYYETQFELKAPSPTTLTSAASSQELVQSISQQLDQEVIDPRRRTALGLSNLPIGIDRKFYEYFIGFDNIQTYNLFFQENSLFSSSTLKVNKCGQVGVKVLDKRPISPNINDVSITYEEDTDLLDSDIYPHCSIEYYLLKRDFSAAGTLLNNTTIPVLPLNKTSIRHERLILSQKTSPSLTTNNIGYLQHYTDEAITEILVYRNGVLLTPTDLITINPLETNGWLIDTDRTNRQPFQQLPMRVAINIQNPNPTDIYTVSYTLKVSDTVQIPEDFNNYEGTIVDLTGYLDAWVGRDNIVYFSGKSRSRDIEYSLLNLGIILRRNSSNVTLTPVVEEYLLASASLDTRKFGDGS